VTARNCLVGQDCVLVAASGGSNLHMAFNERSRGDSFVQPAFARSGPARLTEDSIAEAARIAGRPVSASEASAYWTREALEYVAGHPVRTAGLLAQRFWVSIGNDEIPGNYPHQYFAQVNPLIGWNPLCYGLILSFGVVGFWCARRDRRTLVFPAVFVGAWVSYLPFWTLDRFRLPGVLPLIAGSLFAIREIALRLRGGRRGAAAGLAAAVLLLLAVSLPPRLDERRRSEVTALAYARGADLYLQAGQIERAEACLEQAGRSPWPLPEASLIAARVLAATGRPEEALRELGVFRAWRRDFEDAELLQARLLAQLGDRLEAQRVLEGYLAAWPDSVRVRQALDALRRADAPEMGTDLFR
jgi:tetratricopeptide (TPR) repeat protein